MNTKRSEDVPRLDSLSLIFYWKVGKDSLKYCVELVFFLTACGARTLCSILMKSTWIYMADIETQYFISCFILIMASVDVWQGGEYQLFSWIAPWLFTGGAWREMRHRSLNGRCYCESHYSRSSSPPTHVVRFLFIFFLWFFSKERTD